MFVTVIIAWLQANARISDLNKRIDDTNARFDKRFDDLREFIRSENQALRAEFKADLRRIEEVLNARLTQIEARPVIRP